MKQILKLFILAIPLLLILTGCKNSSYNEIDFETFEKYLDDEDSFVLVIGSSKCSHCSDYQVTMDEIINEYGLDIKYINVLNLSDKDVSKLDAKTHYNYSTPTTVFFDNGKLDNTSTIRGAQSKENVVKKLTKKGYIK
ncbi:MAG: thioredoxin family protein [Bacilli bacterium]